MATTQKNRRQRSIQDSGMKTLQFSGGTSGLTPTLFPGFRPRFRAAFLPNLHGNGLCRFRFPVVSQLVSARFPFPALGDETGNEVYDSRSVADRSDPQRHPPFDRCQTGERMRVTSIICIETHEIFLGPPAKRLGRKILL